MLFYCTGTQASALLSALRLLLRPRSAVAWVCVGLEFAYIG
jgi:hypothetical protein